MKLERLYDACMVKTPHEISTLENHIELGSYLAHNIQAIIELIEAAQRSLDDCGVAGCTIYDEMRAALKPFEDEK